MKVKMSITVSDNTDGEYNVIVSGVASFDEFGIVKKVKIDSSTLGESKACIKKTESVIRSVAERVRAEVLNKIKKNKTGKCKK